MAEEATVVPLIIDLDGTLLKSDLLFESYFGSISLGFAHHWRIMTALARGKAALKAYIASRYRLAVSTLPYDAAVINLARQAKAAGRPVYLATASDNVFAVAVADHLQFFDGVFASDGVSNLSGRAKAERLVHAFGVRGFDYIGNDAADLHVWEVANKAIAVRTSARVLRALASRNSNFEVLVDVPPTLRTWLRAFRVHQYAKNGLIFVPLLTAHLFTPVLFFLSLLAFCSFCLLASAIYIINDLIDLESDRIHPRKRLRPFASGALPIAQGCTAVPILVIVGLALAASVSLNLVAVALGYLILTTSYSLRLKRKMFVDVIVLSLLYTSRIYAGAVASHVVLSEWLLAFSISIFTCLALTKRFVELTALIEKGLPDPSNRNYRAKDRPIVEALAVGSGTNAVTIFALYLASPGVQTMYAHPTILWLIYPVLLYWVSRILMLAHRGDLDDDPVVFALRDNISWLAVIAMAAITIAASL